MTTSDQALIFYRTLEEWCAEARVSIFELGLRCERNDHYFYQQKRRAALPSCASLRVAAGVLRRPYLSLLIAAGYVLLSDLEEYAKADAVGVPSTASEPCS